MNEFEKTVVAILVIMMFLFGWRTLTLEDLRLELMRYLDRQERNNHSNGKRHQCIAHQKRKRKRRHRRRKCNGQVDKLEEGDVLEIPDKQDEEVKQRAGNRKPQRIRAFGE